jgi:hypothetical protein
VQPNDEVGTDAVEAGTVVVVVDCAVVVDDDPPVAVVVVDTAFGELHAATTTAAATDIAIAMTPRCMPERNIMRPVRRRCEEPIRIGMLRIFSAADVESVKVLASISPVS